MDSGNNRLSALNTEHLRLLEGKNRDLQTKLDQALKLQESHELEVRKQNETLKAKESELQSQI